MLRQYKVRKFSTDAKKDQLTDEMLLEIANDFLQLPNDQKNQYSLGAGLYKLRIASKTGRGKSGGSRSILALKEGDSLIWLYIFDKNDKGNISNTELADLKKLSGTLLSATKDQMKLLIESGKLQEIKND